jgi:sulfonate transport system permease protein
MTVKQLYRTISWRPNIAGLVTLAICAFAWEMVIQFGVFDYQYLPAPSVILQGAGEVASSGELLTATLHTLQSVLVGWAIAVAIGVPFGLLLGSSPQLRRYSLATIEVLRPMPAIAFVPVALLLFGFSTETELMVIVLPSLWPVLTGTMGGLAEVHARLEDVGRTFRLSRREILCKISLPAALPAIIVGLRLSLTLAVGLAVLAEMVGNPEGLGYAVVSQQQSLRPDLMFAYVIVIGLLALALNTLLVCVVSVSFPAASTGIKGSWR